VFGDVLTGGTDGMDAIWRLHHSPLDAIRR
jgi:hypothetical protein